MNSLYRVNDKVELKLMFSPPVIIHRVLLPGAPPVSYTHLTLPTIPLV